MKQKGFTLIELMVVVVILGILAGIAVPKMFGLSDKSKVSEAPSVLKTYETLQQAYIAEQSQIGNFGSITFVVPGSEYFSYTDNAASGGTKCGKATATSTKKIGDCALGSTWMTGVPNSTAATIRRVSTADCAKLSPATYKEIGTVSGGGETECSGS